MPFKVFNAGRNAFDFPNIFRTFLKYSQNVRQCLKAFGTLWVTFGNTWKRLGGCGICSKNIFRVIFFNLRKVCRCVKKFSLFGRLRGNFRHLRISQMTVGSLRTGVLLLTSDIFFVVCAGITLDLYCS